MSVDLLANRKHLNDISGIFVNAKQNDLYNLEADVTLHVNAVAGIEFLCENFAFMADNK